MEEWETLRAENESLKAEEKQLNFRLGETWRKIRELEEVAKNLESQSGDGLNNEFKVLRELLQEKEKRIQKLEDELRGTQFVPSAAPGKKLVEMCQQLHKENGKLATQISEEAVHALKFELAELQNELKDSNYKLHKLREANVDHRKDNMELEATIESYAKSIREALEKNAHYASQLESARDKPAINP